MGTTVGYGFFCTCVSTPETFSYGFLYCKSMSHTFCCFCIIEIICGFRVKNRMGRLQIHELMQAKSSRQEMNPSKRSKRWGIIFLVQFRRSNRVRGRYCPFVRNICQLYYFYYNNPFDNQCHCLLPMDFSMAVRVPSTAVCIRLSEKQALSHCCCHTSFQDRGYYQCRFLHVLLIFRIFFYDRTVHASAEFAFF